MATEAAAHKGIAVYRLPLLILGFLALFAGVGAGLARLGWTVPEIAATAAALHGPLMICGFFGVVISLERAVAIGRRMGVSRSARRRPGRHRGDRGRDGRRGVALCRRKRRAARRYARHLPPADARSSRSRSSPARSRGPSAPRSGRRDPRSCGRDVVARVPDPDDCRRAPRAVALPEAVAGGERDVRDHPGRRRNRARRRGAPVGRADVRGGPARAFGLAPQAGPRAPHGARHGPHALHRGMPAVGLRVARDRRCRHAGGGGLAPGSPSYDAAVHALALGFVFSMVFGHAPIIFPAVLRVPVPYQPGVLRAARAAALVARRAARGRRRGPLRLDARGRAAERGRRSRRSLSARLSPWRAGMSARRAKGAAT